MPPKEVILFSSPTCSKCAMLKSHLKSRNVAFTEMDVTTPVGRTELLISGATGTYLPILKIADVRNIRKALNALAKWREIERLQSGGRFYWRAGAV